jgi:hypothetical protein
MSLPSYFVGNKSISYDSPRLAAAKSNLAICRSSLVASVDMPLDAII